MKEVALSEVSLGQVPVDLEPCLHSADPESARAEDPEDACDDGIH